LIALFAGSAEFFGGLFILLGLLTRPVAIVLVVAMAVAIIDGTYSKWTIYDK